MRLQSRPWNDIDDETEAAPVGRASGEEADVALLAACLEPRLAPAEARRAAADLLDRWGSLPGVVGASPEGLAGTPGVGWAGAADVRRVHALAVRLARAEVGSRPIIGSWTALLNYIRTLLQHERVEHFRVLFLDGRNRLIRDETLGVGTTDHAPVYPREVIRRALELSASNLILVHNHPAGDPTPSRADIDLTRQVIEAGRLLKIAVHDHLIVGGGSVASFKSLGLI
jgi:DNA repair protein RadC